MNEMVHYRQEGRVAILSFNNGALNICSKAMVVELGNHLLEIENNDGIGVVVLTGAGQKAFMAGADISGFPDLVASGKDGIVEYLMEDHQVFQRLLNLNKPTIAVINGLALGGGLEIALMCDIRIAEEHARVGLPEITLGMFPGFGGTQLLSRLIGADRAKELIFTGRLIDAEEALQLGVVSKVVPKSSGLSVGLALAENISKKSAPVLSLAKCAIDKGIELPMEDGVALEAHLLSDAFLTQDNAEGIAAFLEKREPIFAHR